MSETKHTQGPWQRDSNMIYELMPNGFKRGIAQFKNKWWASITRDSGCTPEEFESVVCKLAAAPDMLAALNFCNDEFKSETPRLYLIVTRLRAAIAKAKGETK